MVYEYVPFLLLMDDRLILAKIASEKLFGDFCTVGGEFGVALDFQDPRRLRCL